MTPDGKYKPRRRLTLTCFVCGKEFKATRPDARYHSERCRQQISRAMRAVKSLKKHLVTTNAPLAAVKLAEAGKGTTTTNAKEKKK